jgi:DNA-binding CsgD family transcriptional regulator/tetratricopeptide (TPR) repeat protein
VLIGRAVEQARISGLLDDARDGRSGALILHGEAGIGKTALLEGAAATPGFRVLRAQGLETEAEIAYSGLHDLLRPVVDARRDLPKPQADALEAALSLAAGAPPERLAICAGVMGLLAAAASERGPILAIVDDAHLLDRASADAIAFAARRFRDERIAMLLAIRDGETSSFTTEGIADLLLDRLDDREAALLLDGRGTPVTIESKARVLALAQGNPLAILELPDLVAVEPELGTREPSVPSGSLISRAFGRRIEGLPGDTRFALMLAAANDDNDLRTILRACTIAGIEPDALSRAEAAGVLAIDADTLTFRHPLIRAVAYAGATAAERRDAHRALAEALLDRRAEARWAWHRALAAIGPDEVAAAALEEIATTSSSASATARALEQAARLSVDDHSRTRRLIAAALAAEAAGRLRLAESLAGEARRDSIDPIERAEIDHLLGRIWSLDGETTRSVELLTAGASAVAELDPDRAARMLADAVDTAIDDLDIAAPIAERALGLLSSDRASEQLVLLRYGDVLGWKGDAVGAASAWRRSADLTDADDAWSLRLAAEALFSAGLDDEAVATAHAAVDLARARGQLTALTQSLEFLSLADARRGRLLDALDAATEGLDLVASLGQLREERSAAATVAWIEALLGREADCRSHAARATELGDRSGLPAPRRMGLGVLELAVGRPDVAATVMLANITDLDGIGADAIAPCSFVPSLVEALVRSGRAAEAVPIARKYRSVAERSGLQRAEALALRCRGLAEDSIADLRTAADLQIAAANPYEAARTQLCLGSMLRRRGKRLEARATLTTALEAFEASGAHGWGDRARAELEATGMSVRRRATSTTEGLTPQERNVARLVATGLTNREIAGRLFVTTNTVETHLRHIFQKLDVTSRTQLAVAIAGGVD